MNRANSPRPALPRRDFLGRVLLFLTGAALPGAVRGADADTLDLEPFLGEIVLGPWNFAPRGWAFCNGQLLPISQNQALFSILGTTYGGNGQTTFALPDLRGRVAIHAGQGPGLTLRTLGERSGSTTHTLTVAEMPAHSHAHHVASGAATAVAPAGMMLARNAAQIPSFAAAPDTTMAGVISSAGGSQAHTNLQPYTVLNYFIAIQGVFPSP